MHETAQAVTAVTTRRNGYLFFAVFIAGMTSLGVEMLAASLLRPFFGTANLVWAAIIGLMLLYLTVGYFVGGPWADRSPRPALLYQIVAWAALAVGLVPLVARPVLVLADRGFADFDVGMLGGSFIAVLILFAIPMVLLGCVSPFAIRLAFTDVAHSGKTAGRIYAISTIGSFVGTFLPDLVLVPAVGTRMAFLISAGILLLVALVGLALSRPRTLLLYLWMPVLLAGLGWAFNAMPIKKTVGTIYQGESAYNYIQVVQRGDTRYLLLNEGQGIHSVYNLREAGTGWGTWDYFLAAPFFNAPPHGPERVRSLAVVGLACGTISKQYSTVFGPIPIDGVEIDPQIVQVGRRYFDMNEPNLNVVVSDGRYWLAHSERTYSVIGIDAYRLPYIPPHLTTVEFFQQVRNHLDEDGVAVINVGRVGEDYRLVAALVATMQQVFPSVHVVEVPETFNAIVYATVQPTVRENLSANLPLLEHPLLRGMVQLAYENGRPTPSGGMVFTDDHAPVEHLSNMMALSFMLEDLEAFRE